MELAQSPYHEMEYPFLGKSDSPHVMKLDYLQIWQNWYGDSTFLISNIYKYSYTCTIGIKHHAFSSSTKNKHSFSTSSCRFIGISTDLCKCMKFGNNYTEISYSEKEKKRQLQLHAWINFQTKLCLKNFFLFTVGCTV